MDSTHAEADRIRSLLGQQKFSEALAAAEALLAATANHRDALLFVAIAQRFLGRIPDALRTLATLEQHHPRFSRLYEERGLCYVVLKQAPQAIDAFLHAVNINHALPTSWRMLDGLYRMTGQADNAAMAASHVAILQKIPGEVVTATSLFEDGDLDAAEPLIRAYLLQHGNQVEAMRLLARIGIARRVFDDAELLLSAVLELAPDYRMARQEYAAVLLEEHKYSEARRELELLLGKDPENRCSGRFMPRVASDSANISGPLDSTASCSATAPRMRNCTCRSRMLKRLWAKGSRPSTRTIGRRPAGRISAMRIGVSLT